MNRIKRSAAATAESARVEQSRLHVSRDPQRPYSLFVPLHYERNYAYPLLVWLHGAGDDERQLTRVMPLISLRNYAAVAPRGVCPAASGRGCCWGQEPQHVELGAERVFDGIEEAGRSLNLARRRVFLAGYQCGGTMAMRIALQHPQRFAGALSLGGPFPASRSPLSNLNAARRVPLFIASGRQAQRYPVDRACAELRLFHAAGMSVTLRQYPCSDELDPLMLRDMDVWLMEQVTGTSMDCQGQYEPRSEESN